MQTQRSRAGDGDRFDFVDQRERDLSTVEQRVAHDLAPLTSGRDGPAQDSDAGPRRLATVRATAMNGYAVAP